MVEQGSILATSEWYIKSQEVIYQLNKISEKYGITYDQFLVMEQIIKLGHNTPGKIASVFKTSAPAASRKINILQRKNYVTKVRDMENDQRTVWLEVTSEGIRVYQSVQKEIEEKILLSD